MSGVELGQWMPAVLAVAAWPAGIVVIVLGVLLLAPRQQQAAVLSSVADVVRAARARSTSNCTDCPDRRTHLTEVASSSAARLDDAADPDLTLAWDAGQGESSADAQRRTASPTAGS